MRALHDDDEGRLAAGAVDDIRIGRVEQHAVLHVNRLELAGAHAEERHRRGRRIAVRESHAVRPALRAPQPHGWGVEQAFPGVRAVRDPEQARAVGARERVAATLLSVLPAGGQHRGRLNLLDDHAFVAHARAEHGIAERAQRGDQTAEMLSVERGRL